MNKKYLFSISLLISLLIILIPIAAATELETYDNLVLKTKEEKINLYQNLGDDPYVTDRGQLSDPGQACVEQHKETSSFADSLDNNIISTLEKIATILFTICTTMSAIDTVITTISLVIGMWPECCKIPSDYCCGEPGCTCGIICTEQKVVFESWSVIYAHVKGLCCFVNCGWCTGAADCFGILGINLKSISLGAIPGGGIGQFGLSPYDNIYTAIGCLCPIAIIFNLRKLKTIYDVYDCCIQEACTNGLSTEACERQLDEATCMYWEGSIYSILAKILLSILTGLIAGKLVELFGLSNLLSCLYAVLKIAQVPIVIKNVMSAWKYMGRSFKGIDCKDLGFDDVKEEILEDWQYVTLVDKDDDGVYDYNVPEWTKVKDNEYTTTLRLWDDKQKEYVIKSFTKTKEEGDLLATITDKDDKKVSTLEWEKLKGSNVPARVNIYSDGSARIGYVLYDNVEIEGNKIKFTRKDKGKEISETFDLSKPSEAQYIANGFGLDEYKLGKVTNAEGNTINFENGEVEIVNLGDKDKPQVLEITPRGKETITETRHHEGSILSTSEKSVIFTTSKGAEIEIQRDTTLFDALKNPATLESARNAISAGIQAGLSEQEIAESIYENGKLEHIEGITGGHRTTIIDPSNNQIIQKDKIGDLTTTTTTSLETKKPTTMTFEKVYKAPSELPYEYAKNIDVNNINFDESTSELIIVSTKDETVDAYKITRIGDIKVLTKKTGAQFLISEEGKKEVAGGTIKDYIIHSEEKTTSIDVDVMDSFIKASDRQTLTNLNEQDLNFLQSAYERFGNKIGDKENLNINKDLQGNIFGLIIEDKERNIHESLDNFGVYQRVKDSKTIVFEDPREGLTVEGPDIKSDKGSFDSMNSDFISATWKRDDGTISQTTNKLKDGTLVASHFDENAKLKEITFVDVQKEQHTLTPDNKGNLKISNNLLYSVDGKLQIQSGGKWVDHDEAPIIDKATALKDDLSGNYKNKIGGLDKLSEVEKERTLRELELDEGFKKEVNNLAKEKENSIKAVAEQVKKDKSTAEEVVKKEEKKPAPDSERIAREELEQKVAYQMMYEILWTTLDYILGEKVNDFVENKCKEDYKASYPPQDTPTESGGPATCEDTENNVYNAQFISKTESDSNTCQYKVTYGIGACNHEINFVVQFQGTGSNENIEGGTLALGQTLSRNRIITSSSCTHQRICIIIKGEDITKCFPP